MLALPVGVLRDGMEILDLAWTSHAVLALAPNPRTLDTHLLINVIWILALMMSSVNVLLDMAVSIDPVHSMVLFAVMIDF